MPPMVVNESLQLPKESERLLFIKNHSPITISVLQEVGRTKRIIKLNGDLKSFDPIDFKGFHFST
ncbi:hypothetical protein MNBD_BACTEROID03-494 [hydrothermal vent metagenome]|uniref:Uncharacterized protein n=1 Tax=hydrothermal vent metagenome TaxID=652676 RepID=A0A3B0TG25_9ZZZZ